MKNLRHLSVSIHNNECARKNLANISESRSHRVPECFVRGRRTYVLNKVIIKILYKICTYLCKFTFLNSIIHVISVKKFMNNFNLFASLMFDDHRKIMKLLN